MADFGSDYWNAMDRTISKNLKVSTRDLGTSAKPGDVLSELKTNIHSGASHVELGFTGTGKGMLSQGSTTPEMFDTEKRKEIRRLSKLNEVTVSTHASLKLQGLSGIFVRIFGCKYWIAIGSTISVWFGRSTSNLYCLSTNFEKENDVKNERF